MGSLRVLFQATCWPRRCFTWCISTINNNNQQQQRREYITDGTILHRGLSGLVVVVVWSFLSQATIIVISMLTVKNLLYCVRGASSEEELNRESEFVTGHDNVFMRNTSNRLVCQVDRLNPSK